MCPSQCMLLIFDFPTVSKRHHIIRYVIPKITCIFHMNLKWVHHTENIKYSCTQIRRHTTLCHVDIYFRVKTLLTCARVKLVSATFQQVMFYKWLFSDMHADTNTMISSRFYLIGSHILNGSFHGSTWLIVKYTIVVFMALPDWLSNTR